MLEGDASGRPGSLRNPKGEEEEEMLISISKYTAVTTNQNEEEITHDFKMQHFKHNTDSIIWIRRG